MKTNKKNNRNDSFSEAIKDNIQNYTLPIDENCWVEIERRIKPKCKITAGWVSFFAAIAAAVVLIFLFRPFSEKESNIQNTIIHTKQNSILNADTNLLKTDTKNIVIQTDFTNQKANTTKQNNNFTQVGLQTFESKCDTQINVAPPSTVLVDKKENMPLQESAVPTMHLSKSIEKSKSTTSKNSLPKQPRTKREWFIAAVLSTGGNESSGIQNRNRSNFNQDLILNISSNAGLPTPNVHNNTEDFSNTKYLPTLSFGFILHKTINRYIGIESGINYTYLFSEFECSNIDYHSKSEMSLHYIGIPLNMVVSPLDFKRWDFYFSAGGMVEKGIFSKYSGHVNNQNFSEKDYFIDGVQWSINASAGVTYKASQKIGVYFEPRVSHYFNNDQPVSIRTRYPLVISFNLGFRYSF